MLCGSERKRAGAGGSQWKQTGSQWKPVEVVEDIGKQWKTCGRQGRGWKGCGRVGRGPEEVQKAVGKCRRGRKAQEVTVRYKCARKVKTMC